MTIVFIKGHQKYFHTKILEILKGNFKHCESNRIVAECIVTSLLQTDDCLYKSHGQYDLIGIMDLRTCDTPKQV